VLAVAQQPQRQHVTAVLVAPDIPLFDSAYSPQRYQGQTFDSGVMITTYAKRA
jgi:hypothetical protein